MSDDFAYELPPNFLEHLGRVADRFCLGDHPVFPDPPSLSCQDEEYVAVGMTLALEAVLGYLRQDGSLRGDLAALPRDPVDFDDAFSQAHAVLLAASELVEARRRASSPSENERRFGPDLIPEESLCPN